MAATIYYDKDADLANLKGKTIAIIGYGSQGHAQAQNLRDSGVNVVIGQRPGGKNYDLAISHGFKPVSAAEATKQADAINILVPDELQGDLYEKEIKPNLKPGAILMCSHGFNIHFGFIKPPEGHDALLVAPKGPGHLVRSEFVAGGGVPCLIATSEGASDETFKLGMAYAKAIGGTRGGVIQTTIKEETETDLFGEQAVLCGGAERAGEGRFRNARRSWLSARDGLLRVHARVEADRRPVLPGRPELHAVQREQHGRVRRLHPRPANCDGRDEEGNEEDPDRNSGRQIREGVDRRSKERRQELQGDEREGQEPPGRSRRREVAEVDELD